jgi:hypothetical protein
MPEIILNLFPVQAKSKELLLYRIVKASPETSNRDTRFRLAAKIAKKATETQNPVFSVGDEIFAAKDIDTKYTQEIDIEGTKVPFEVEIQQIEAINLGSIEHGTETLVNRLVDWYYKEKIPDSFRIENANYQGINIFARLESRLHKISNININEGILRATRDFSGKPYLLLDIEYRKTWEQTLWESVKYYVQTVLNKDAYLPDSQTISAINEKFGHVGKKWGEQVQGKNKVGEYEVIEFDFTKNPNTPGTAGLKSQREYFESVYGSEFKIKDEKQPLVKVRNMRGKFRGGENYHVPELLIFGYIPQHLRSNKTLMSAITNMEKPAPRGRYSQMLSLVQGDPFGRAAGFAEDEFVSNFADISKEPVRVTAKALPPIRAKMGDSVFSVTSDSDFLGSIWKRNFHRVPNVKKVTIIYGKKHESDIQNFYNMLTQEAAERGLILPDADPIAVEEETPDEFISALGKQVSSDIVISFMSKEDDEFYDRLKEELLVKHGVLHQNISYENTLDVIAEYERRGNQKGIKSILTLLSMQLCAKLGGAPWAFAEPIYKANFPILGLDVAHDVNGSITGSCVVFDPYGEYLFSDAKITSLNDLLTSVLKRYIETFGKPEGLVIFRDGLSFTQEQQFLLSPKGELEIIDEVLAKFEFSNSILIMEKKGTHLRMFKKLEGIRVDNPDPGTVVIGYPFEENEMLMVSQETPQGTVNPVFYKIIRSGNANTEEIANAINKLCRHHWNTNRAIKIPAPAQHANEITYIIKNVLRGNPPKNPDVLNKPFYL